MEEAYDQTLLLITEAVSDALETPVKELPPLSESISLDGLDAILSHTDPADVSVSFSYAGLRVFVHSEGVVYVRPAEEDGGPEFDRPFDHGS